MLSGTAEDFISELIHDPQRLMFIAKMSKEQRGEALRAIGFHFSAKELDDYLCGQYYSIAPALVFLGDGDVRDIVMEKWGNCMEEKSENRSDRGYEVLVPNDEHSHASP